MNKWTLVLAFISPAHLVMADLVLDIRADDPGFMTVVTESEIDVIKTLSFEDPDSAWMKERDGFRFWSILHGMDTECRETELNPCQWPDSELCLDKGTGTKPVERTFGTPNVPFETARTPTQGTIFVYHSNDPNLITGNPTPHISAAYEGCPELGRADWGDGPWSIIFDTEYTAVCFDVRYIKPELRRRQHFKFWRNSNGIAEKVGHHDLVGEPGEESRDQRVCWNSSVPFEAASTWQDGPGIWWMGVSVGVAKETACEKATREAAEICALEE